MDVGNKLKLENPIKSANFLSKLFFGWPIDIIRKSTRKALDLSDLYETLDSDESERLGNELEQNWEKELNRAKMKNVNPSLMRALSKTYLFDFMMWGLMNFAQIVIFRSSQPIVLSNLISLFDEEHNQEDIIQMYLMGTLVVVFMLAFVLSYHHHNFGLSKIGMRMRIALSSLIYRKMTRLSQKASTETAAVQVVNLLSNDINKFDQAVLSLHNIWILPFHITLVTYYLWTEVQIASLVGVGAMILISLPGQSYLGKVIGRLRYAIALKSDNRVALMNQVITGIHVIKMYAWENFFEKIIDAVRRDEIRYLSSDSYIKGVIASINFSIDKFTLFLTVITYVILGNVITASRVFALAQLFNVLRVTLNFFFPMAIRDKAETIVSVKRIQEFLVLEERQTSENVLEKNDHGICFSNVTASWTTNDDIKNISLVIPNGSICAIVGAVGAGKTSMLQLLLGELPLKSGTLSGSGVISYASQEPWLFSSTVRNNIIFGQPFDKEWYLKVIRICALRSDFEQFPNGDQTVVGERGVALSGGQRARINLARCVYRRADIYLLDDPLSAVDTHVSRHLFEECIQKHLKGKTRILVTHQLQYLQKADLVVVVDDGQILAKGTFQELQNSDVDFNNMFVSSDDDEQKEEGGNFDEMARIRFSRFSNSSIRSNVSCSASHTESMEEKDSALGNRSPFLEYLKAANNKCLIVMVILIMLSAQAFLTAADFWVAFWTHQETLRQSGVESHAIFKTFSIVTNTSKYHMDTNSVETENSTHHILSTEYFIYIYTALIIAAIVTMVVRSIGFFKVCILSSTNLHSTMLRALLKAPMKFFDTTPSGSILNRFSKDLGAVDNVLSEALVHAVGVLIFVSGLCINVVVSNPYTIAPLVILMMFAWKLFSWYLLTGNYIKHLEGSTKSPVISHVNSTLKGITTIRAARAVEEHIRQFDDHQNVHTSAWYLTITLPSTFGLWMDILCLIYIVIVTFTSVYLITKNAMQSSLAGLAISQSLILSGMCQQGVRNAAETIYQLTSVDRILQYTTLEPEGIFESNKISKQILELEEWPRNGRIEFKNIHLRYGESDPPVLKNLNFTVEAGEKIGIVGRTGAGKSSLITALFRLTEIDGSILIDGVNTKTIGLTDLRHVISIIPQEPVLFSSTIRNNLDPSGKFEDCKLWEAIEKVELKDAVPSLDFVVTDGGANFSMGQRQLICLARAILRNNKILVLDEATANVDQRTDAFIQTTIREQFKDCTVLTIAHRLNTIMYCDKILVMNFGVLAEFDHPHELLQATHGIFHDMVLETGPKMSEVLKTMAKEAYYEGGNFRTPL